ncbi:hypothetical protein ACPRNU_10515 [Chromobacterium vaccinii]|uniref:hypothetical protein n=1 Tax=Chromobacterium TaxID=535 RepID=UPI001305270C|nr:hypothetical protein [Chromobacterium sp. ATCC 53434]
MKKNETLPAADFETQLQNSVEIAAMVRLEQSEVEEVSGGLAVGPGHTAGYLPTE